MALATPMLVGDSGVPRLMNAGDILNQKEVVQSVANAAGVTLTPANLLTGLLLRSGAAGVSDALPSATVLLAALQSQYQGSGANTPAQDLTGYSFRFKIINANTGTLTLTAGTNCTLATDTATTIATVTVREYLAQITCGAPSQVYAATTTNASAIVTGLTADQTKNLVPGMAVSGTGIAGSSTIISVQPGVGFTMNNNATATGSLVAITFAPTYTVRAIS